MAIINWHGREYVGAPVMELDNGDWIFCMPQHGPRWSAGGTIRLKQSEIIEMAAAEMPPSGREADRSELA